MQLYEYRYKYSPYSVCNKHLAHYLQDKICGKPDCVEWWIVFAEWLTEERRIVWYPAGTIIRDSHHRKSPTHRVSRIWIYAEPESRVSWRNLCGSDNHCTTAPFALKLFDAINLFLCDCFFFSAFLGDQRLSNFGKSIYTFFEQNYLSLEDLRKANMNYVQLHFFSPFLHF